MLAFKNDSGAVFVDPHSVGAVLSESRTQARIWLKGGGTFIVHGDAADIAKRVETARGTVRAGEEY